MLYFGSLLLVLVFIIYDLGRMAGRMAREAENECDCWDHRTCAFGPGIVGRQECSYHQKWTRCEPVVQAEAVKP